MTTRYSLACALLQKQVADLDVKIQDVQNEIAPLQDTLTQQQASLATLQGQRAQVVDAINQLGGGTSS